MCPTTLDLTLTDTAFQVGCHVRCYNAGRTGRCSRNASNAVPGHDLVCVKARAERTRRHERVKSLLRDSFQRSGSLVEVEPRVSWSDAFSDKEDCTRSRRGDLKITGGAGIGASTSILAISIASPFHTTRVQSLPSTLNNRYHDKLVRYRSVLCNFHPIIMSPTGMHHHNTIAIFKSLSACGVDVVELKRSIAIIILLKSRARSYRDIYDAAKTPRIAISDIDHRLSPPPHSSVRSACARTQTYPSPASPAPVDRQMDTGY